MARPSTPFQVLCVDGISGDGESIAESIDCGDDQLEVTHAAAESDGLDVLADGETDVDCVVSAYRLPESDGLSFLERVQAERPDLPCVLLARDGSEQLASEAISAGITDYVPLGDGTDDGHTVVESVRRAVEAPGLDGTDRDSDDELHRVYERITDGFFAVDRDWHYTYANEEGARLVGRSREELIGKRVWDAFPDLEGSPFEEALRTAMESGETTRIEEHYPAHDTWYSVTVYPADDGISIYFRDITEQKEREQTLELERNRFQSLFDNLGEPVVEMVFEDANPVIKRVNDAFTEAFGVGEEAVGENLDELIVPEHDESADRINEHAREGQPVEREVRRGTDEVHPYLLRSAPFVGPDGQQRGHAIYIDISDRKDRERELRRRNERLDSFASVVSHDLRNPLNTLELSLELAQQEGGQENFERCHRAIDRMNQLIEDLLTLARQGKTVAETEPVALRAVGRDAWKTVETGSANLELATDERIRADRARLEQLLENLVRNAVEHGGDGVTVTVGDSRTGFYVADDGPGIPAEEREAVFESGYTTSDSGTGLGLAIVTDIAEAHGWQVEAGVSEDGGTRIDVTGVDFF